jgi:hypothetical protein
MATLHGVELPAWVRLSEGNRGIIVADFPDRPAGSAGGREWVGRGGRAGRAGPSARILPGGRLRPRADDYPGPNRSLTHGYPSRTMCKVARPVRRNP